MFTGSAETTLKKLGVTGDADFLAMLDASPDCIKLIDVFGRVAFMNDWGMSSMDIEGLADIEGKRWSDLWPAEAQATVEDAVDRALAGDATRFEAFCPTANGHPRWWDVAVSPMSVDGKVTAILSISRDISDRVMREQRADYRERVAIRKLRRNAGEKDYGQIPFTARTGPEAAREASRIKAAPESDFSPEAHSHLDLLESHRVAKLVALDVLDGDPDPRLDRLTELAARLLDMPTALISLVDQDRQWFLSRVGMKLNQTPRSQSFCSLAIETPDQPYAVEDATLSTATRDNPLVTAENGIRSYLGIPLVLSSGEALGSFCVIDTEPRAFTKVQIETLRTLADASLAIIELKHAEALARRADIINAELKHRMGNTYAQVSSLIGLIAQSAEDKTKMAAQLREHINALSRTQARIAQGGWATIDLIGLSEEVFGKEASRIACSIDSNFDITPSAAFLLTLAFQELSTNSRKHGALRHEDHGVDVQVTVEDDNFVLRWNETNPPMKELSAATPRSGFGRKLLTRIVPLGMGGSAELTFRDDGMSYELILPRDRVELPGHKSA